MKLNSRPWVWNKCLLSSCFDNTGLWRPVTAQTSTSLSRIWCAVSWSSWISDSVYSTQSASDSLTSITADLLPAHWTCVMFANMWLFMSLLLSVCVCAQRLLNHQIKLSHFCQMQQNNKNLTINRVFTSLEKLSQLIVCYDRLHWMIEFLFTRFTRHNTWLWDIVLLRHLLKTFIHARRANDAWRRGRVYIYIHINKLHIIAVASLIPFVLRLFTELLELHHPQFQKKEPPRFFKRKF